MSKKCFIIDGHYHCFKSFFALPHMETKNGTPTNVVYGLAKVIENALKEEPDYLLFAFDSPGDTFRHEIYPEYKANREEAPEEFKVQIPLVFRLVEAYRIPLFAEQGYEADDIIATLTSRITELHPDVEVLIESRDKDLYQLLSPRVSLVDISAHTIFKEKDLEKKWGISPDQVRDFLSLTGDTSDNIPGIPGIGPKTASRLLREYRSVENLLASLDGLKGKIREKISANREKLDLAGKLVRLEKKVPVTFDLEKCRRREPDKEKLRDLYVSLEFKSLLKEDDVPSSASSHASERTDYVLVTDGREFRDLMDRIEKAGMCVLDLETTGLDPHLHEITGIAFSLEEKTGYFVPFPTARYRDRSPLARGENMDRLRALIGNAAVRKIGQNIKYDVKFFIKNGFVPRGYAFDTMIAAYLLNPGEAGSYGLTRLAARLLDYRMIELEEISSRDAEGAMDLANIDLDSLSDYACEDVDITLRLYHRLEPEIRSQEFTRLLEEVEIPLSIILARMELNGVFIDTAILEDMSRRMQEEIDRLTGTIHELAGTEFNVHSPRQLAEVLFEKLRLPPQKKTKTGFSTDEEVLRLLANIHPLPAKVLEVRRLTKLKNTYIDVLPGMVHPATGRIHPQFNQVVTATGRLSSSHPNLQNIPVRSERGRNIRQAFRAQRDGDILLAADYSQIELRMLAHFSGDENLRASFAEGRDIHAVTAAVLNGVREEDVTPEMRYQAKAVNFGIIYGQGPYGLSRAVGISQKEARKFIEAYFEAFPRIKEFVDTTVARARETGEVRTILNRRRSIPELRSPNKNTQRAGERIAVNTVIQGSAADLIKKAMVDIQRAVDREGYTARFILQIHDELVFELPEEEMEGMTAIVKEAMEGAMALSVPLVVHIERGKTWKEMK